MLPQDTFKTIVASTPLISIDLIVRDPQNNVLLGKRVNRPTQGCWFVPGGRVLKDESIEQAFILLLKIELSIDKVNAIFKGIFQHFYDDNFSEENFTTHYVVLAYEVILPVILHHYPFLNITIIDGFQKRRCYIMMMCISTPSGIFKIISKLIA